MRCAETPRQEARANTTCIHSEDHSMLECTMSLWKPMASAVWEHQARIQDFGQEGPAEIWLQGGTEPNICSKYEVFPLNCLKTAWFWRNLGGRGHPCIRFWTPNVTLLNRPEDGPDGWEIYTQESKRRGTQKPAWCVLHINSRSTQKVNQLWKMQQSTVECSSSIAEFCCSSFLNGLILEKPDLLSFSAVTGVVALCTYPDLDSKTSPQDPKKFLD